MCLSTIHEEDRLYFIEALNRHAVRDNYRLMIFNTCTDLFAPDNINDSGEVAVFDLIPYHLLSALIVFPHFLQNLVSMETIVKRCQEHHIPIISIDKELEGCYCFSFSYAGAFEKLCQHIIQKHGAKEIFMIAGLKGNSFSEARVDAYRKALEEENIPFSPDNVAYGDFWEGPTVSAMIQWFVIEKRKLPDAIVCANDTMAIVASSFLQKMGYKIPQDCIITGFDGILQAGYHIPHLTTCHQDYDLMGEQLMKAIETLSHGGTWQKKTEIPFFIRLSQSCGCEEVSAEGVNDAVQVLLDRLTQYKNRQNMLCSALAEISNMSSISELPEILLNKFYFDTMAVALNDDAFREPDFGNGHRGDKAFSEKVNIIFQRYFWKEEIPCTTDRKNLTPHLEKAFQKERPLVICSIHFLDLVFGYNIIQPDVNFDEYIKMHTLMTALDAALGSFHGRMQIKAINTRLVSVNDELEKLYIHDHMTGLFNRRGFYRNFQIQLQENMGKSVSVILISADLDGLKKINDTYGHLEGDNAISMVGKALQSCALHGEICARFGGDEFMAAGIIATQKEERYFESFRQRFADYLSQYNEFSGKPYQVESSIGFSSEPLTSNFDLDHMIKEADDKMYADKVARKKARK